MGSASLSPLAEASCAGRPPLVVDLDGTLLRGDTLYETFAAAFFKQPLATLKATVQGLSGGRAVLKRRLCELAPIEVETLPIRGELLAYLGDQKSRGRSLHLATAADRSIATRVAETVGLFDGVYATDGDINLKGRAKAEALTAAFPGGFSYAGDSLADLEVWKHAESAVVICSGGLAAKAAGLTEVEQRIESKAAGPRQWAKAARPHQWAKNALVLAPLALGFSQVTITSLLHAVAALMLLCVLSSLTYVVNDIADIQADRRHATKRRRPFASGAIPVRDGLLLAGLGIPLVLAAGLLIAPEVAATLLAYCTVTLAYSFGLKRIPLADCFIIGTLFTLRLVLGVTAAHLIWSAWLLTFAVSFFFSLALAKRHTELVGGGPLATGPVPGRGYRYEDRSLTLVFGVAASTTSIIIVVQYLMDEVFPAGAYRHPDWLWAAPALIFLWVARIWLLANRGEMHDDPVVFALKDRVSHGLGAVMVLAFLLALL
jgi:4-hydroxybenzoate polyprenyltransferase